MKKQQIDKVSSKRNEEFLDADHKTMDLYYDLMEKNISLSRKEEILNELIEIDPDFYDPYIQLSYMLQENEEYTKASKILYQGYQRALARISDKEDNLPKSLSWLWLENRHIIRIIDAWANNLWEEGKTPEALEIFKKLLKSNPNDNIGARHSILAIRLGLDPDYETTFEMKGMPGYIDSSKVSNWFEKNSKKFPEEFEWWWRLKY